MVCRVRTALNEKRKGWISYSLVTLPGGRGGGGGGGYPLFFVT